MASQEAARKGSRSKRERKQQTGSSASETGSDGGTATYEDRSPSTCRSASSPT